MCQIWLLYKVCEYNVEFCYICASQLAEAKGSQQAAVLFDELGAGLKREVRQHILRCFEMANQTASHFGWTTNRLILLVLSVLNHNYMYMWLSYRTIEKRTRLGGSKRGRDGWRERKQRKLRKNKVFIHLTVKQQRRRRRRWTKNEWHYNIHVYGNAHGCNVENLHIHVYIQHYIWLRD